MSAQEKAAGVLVTPEASEERTHHDSTAAALRKRESNLIANAALRGIAIVRIEDDYGKTVYIASRYALTRQLDNLDDAERFLEQIGAGHG